MSTYSWSYKNAPHQKTSVKQAEDDTTDSALVTATSVDNTTTDNTAIAVTASGLYVAKPLVHANTARPNEDQSTVKPKRLNWKAKLYVGNLNKKTTEASLAYYFRVFGDLDDVKLIRDHDTNESRCFAFITFEKIESAEKAKKWCSFNYPTIDENNIIVASAERKLPKNRPLPRNEYLAKRHPSQTLFWEYKWSNEQNAEVFGPYETNLMLAWKNQGYFDGGCWVRQVHRGVGRVVENNEGENRESREPSELETPSKKLKLVVDYSDSEEEDEMVENSGEEKNEEQRKLEGDGTNEMVESARKETNEGQRKRENSKVNEEFEKENGTKENETKGYHGAVDIKQLDVEECVEKIVEMIVESVSKENEQEDILKQYDEYDISSRCEHELALELEHKARKTFSDSEEEDMIDENDDSSTEFVAVSEIDFNFFP